MKWKKVKGWTYVVSDTGLVKNTKTRRIRGHSYITSDGYKAITLLDMGERKAFRVHRLVCEAFHGAPPSNKHQAAHNNGNRVDNRARNLRWATTKENGMDTRSHGSQRGRRNGNNKLSEDDVLRIRFLCDQNIKQSIIAKCFGIKQGHVSSIKRRILWKHLVTANESR